MRVDRLIRMLASAVAASALAACADGGDGSVSAPPASTPPTGGGGTANAPPVVSAGPDQSVASGATTFLYGFKQPTPGKPISVTIIEII